MSRIDSNTTFVPRMRLLFPMHGTLMSVDRNERVYGVQESYAHNREGREHRYQVMLIPRGDALSGFWWDLGPSSDFVMQVGETLQPAPPYLQPILLEHSVAECIEMADSNRMDDFAAKLLTEQIAESTLFEDYRRLIEADLQIVKNRSTFGPAFKREVHAYSAAGARAQKERLELRRGY